MTDTTDIAALREELKGAVLPAQLRAIALSLLDQLEAERQRADNASFRENHLNEMLNEKIQQNSELRLEIAALKGEQVPYAYSYNYAGCETCEGFQDWRKKLSRERPPEWMVETGKVTDLVELFTAPQLPVVSEWSNAQCLEFLSVAFRHNDIDGEIEFDDIRLGVKFALSAAPKPGGE